ncbi:hypothetical protein Tsubulata_017740 [Turnera subulata]|uniref:Uncharacterized protein n=1 Tax=Turnera subulata TaxID=218843 RepID=A0A9Q0JNR4_9ROSI|nr:hypothetical protein Tsubulata_017740 [Turnera subulata]
MARQANTLFLEEWLRSNSGNSGSNSGGDSSSSSSARAIIQAWAELRDTLTHQSFQPHHLQSLRILLDSRASLHVADPQAKLLLSILSARNLILPLEAYPLLLRLLYIWVRKSFRPTSVLIDSAVEVLSRLLTTEFGSKKTPELLSEGVLLLGAFSFVPSAAETTKKLCLELLCRLLEDEYRLVSPYDGLIADILAGIGYALCCSVNVHYVRSLNALLGIWGKEDGPRASISNGLMILHLVEWAISGFLKLHSQEKLLQFAEVLETLKEKGNPFALAMASGGVLRALNRSEPSGQAVQIVSRLRISAESCIESVARDLILNTRDVFNYSGDCTTSLMLRCISLALARGGSVSSRPPLFISLAAALLTEIFPLRYFYYRMLEATHDRTTRLDHNEIKEHLNSVAFREAGSITAVFCNQYVSADEKDKVIVENKIWGFCQELYSLHRQVALLLRGTEDELLRDIEKIAESAFLMVVVFSLSVTKHKLNSKFLSEAPNETSLSILVSFSCVEYFRRIRLPEYMDAVRGVVGSVQEDEASCISFIESMPSYTDLTSPHEFLQKVEYAWFKDEVQTARVLFYLRVIPTFIEHVPGHVFSRVIAPIMFLYMGHPNGKVARASHSLFVAFVSSGKESEERASLKEQLAFYYIQRSLAGYPDFTPFEGMASGVAALVRNLPAGSAATFYCVHSLVEKTKKLCSNVKADFWKNWQGESDPCKKLLELLLRLISLVDIQVLPELMKLLAQMIVELPKDGQNTILNELYPQVAESDDVTRKPTLVSWLQSVSYLCSQSESGSAVVKGTGNEESSPAKSSIWDRFIARL